MYDVSGETGQRLGGPCRDAVIFLLVTSVCYFVTSFTYVHWGYYIYALICSLYIVIFSYNITYCDSLNPGVMPPSPISPFKYRASSGHTFHLSYVMTVLNGIVFFLVEPWVIDIAIPSA
ncbi:ARL6IP6 [Bugula neritina]|uniref:ARL6IP6 n=1 Tax=Bugula neritina TaxID=10212 RepID=A0A7J7JWR4_BUGNE|nr:ARL6IP6 [Bugula neritina]